MLASETKEWQSRKGWESKSIGSGAKLGVGAIWFIAIFWNAISSPVLFQIPDELASGNYPVLLALVFPLVGVGLLYKAIVTTLEYRRFGKVLFEMDPYPGGIGGHVGGKVRVSSLSYVAATDADAQLNVKLECVYSYMSGSGKDRSRKETIKWAEEGAPHVKGASQGVELVFRFDIPENLPEADIKQADAYHFWRLNIDADVEGIDLSREYNIPVFKTGEKSQYVSHDISAQVATKKQQDSEETRLSIAQGNFDIAGLSRAMKFYDKGDELKLVFPMFRNKLLTLFSVFFAGGFGFASVSIIMMAFESGWAGIFIGLFSIPFLVVAIVAGVASIYLPFNNLRVSIDANQVTVLRRLLFIPVLYQKVDLEEIRSLSIKKSGSTGSGVGKVEHYKLHALDKAGTTLTLAEDIDGEDVALHFKEYLARRLKLT